MLFKCYYAVLYLFWFILPWPVVTACTVLRDYSPNIYTVRQTVASRMHQLLKRHWKTLASINKCARKSMKLVVTIRLSDLKRKLKILKSMYLCFFKLQQKKGEADKLSFSRIRYFSPFKKDEQSCLTWSQINVNHKIDFLMRISAPVAFKTWRGQACIVDIIYHSPSWLKYGERYPPKTWWGPVSMSPYSCSKITKTRIQISLKNSNGIFLNISHQIMV